MKLNIFRLKDKADEWRKVKHELYNVWVGHQPGSILPMWCDSEFKKQFKQIRQNYTLAQCKEALKLA